MLGPPSSSAEIALRVLFESSEFVRDVFEIEEIGGWAFSDSVLECLRGLDAMGGVVEANTIVLEGLAVGVDL